MKIYHLKNCDTCKKAIKFLGEKLTSKVDVRDEGVPRALLASWLEDVGADVLINKRSTTWRGLDESDRASDPLELLLANPTLMKRPVIVDGSKVFVGWGPEVRKAFGND